MHPESLHIFSDLGPLFYQVQFIFQCPTLRSSPHQGSFLLHSLLGSARPPSFLPSMDHTIFAKPASLILIPPTLHPHHKHKCGFLKIKSNTVTFPLKTFYFLCRDFGIKFRVLNLAPGNIIKPLPNFLPLSYSAIQHILICFTLDLCNFLHFTIGVFLNYYFVLLCTFAHHL